MRPRLALLVVLAVFAAAACSGKEKTHEIKPLPDLPPVTTTTLVDLSGIKLSGVPGKTTTTIALGPGGATIKGTVAGPDGAAVGGATIHVERLVGDAVAAQDFPSNPDGTFTIPTVLGGRYRVRAYVPDPYDLAMAAPELFFLANTDTKQLNLTMAAYSGVAVTSSIAPDPPFVNAPANLVVQVVTQMVDAKGIVRGTPVPGAKVELFGSGSWLVRTTNPTTTDDKGLALFQMECSAVGDQGLSAVVNDTVNAPLTIGACTEPPPPTTTTVAPPPTTAAASTTTTAAKGPGATTTTTRPSSTTTSATTTTTRPPNTTTTAPPKTTTTRKP